LPIMKLTLIYLLSCIIVCSKLPAQKVMPASIFGNNMVVQQGIKAPIWGTSKAHEKIVVHFNGQTKKVNADKDGQWMVKLAPMKAGGPFEMLISSGNDVVTYGSVYVGEVWLASGQSNMVVNLASVNDSEQEIASANYPEIRFFNVGYNISHRPLSTVKGQWQICTPENASKFSGAAYFFARALHVEKNIPVGIIASCWGASPAEAWISGEALITHQDFKDSIVKYNQLNEDWEQLYKNYLIEKEAEKKSKKPAVLPAEKNYPSALYNAMIAPFVPYGIKGILWYQGENNAKGTRAFQYRTVLPLLITDWRSKWANKTLPFAYVQLANFKAKNVEPIFNDDWATLRESQLLTLQLPNTAMVVTIDIGDAKTIHPTNKQDVGKRLYLAAKHLAYNGLETYSGPSYQSMTIAGNTATISFTHTGNGLEIRNNSLSGFAIAGEDKKFYWADAKIVRNKVIVSSHMVAKPVAVRYAWAINPFAQLYNMDGLPASPFRTDNW
jgi:sialate O-acetylesterase